METSGPILHINHTFGVCIAVVGVVGGTKVHLFLCERVLDFIGKHTC